MWRISKFLIVHSPPASLRSIQVKEISGIWPFSIVDDENRLSQIFKKLEKVSKKYLVVLPLHPKIKKSLEQLNFNFDNSSLTFIPPIVYLDMMLFEKKAKVILTDSGGVQKEAYFHEVPCITLRDKTEWIELVDLGYNILLRDLCGLSACVDQLGTSKVYFTEKTLYGNGN